MLPSAILPLLLLLAGGRPQFDAGYYHLTLDIRVDSQYVFGVTRVEGIVREGVMDTLVLDFTTSMRVDSVTGASGRLSFSHQSDLIKIALDRSYGPGEGVAVTVTYQGRPQRSGFGTFAFGTLSNGDPYVWTLSEPYGAREWWPSIDHPSDKADSVRVSVTVPEAMRVGSNGLLRKETDNGDGTRTFDWFSGYPISTYLVSIAAGVYDVYEQTYERPDSLGFGPLSLPLLHYAYRGSSMYEGTSTGNGWKRVVEVLPVQESWFGPYPFPEEKYGHAQFTFGGGMEHQTMSSMGNNGIGLIAHELAHQWFGDLITMETWPHLWLNEGFATYAELLTWQAREEISPGTFDRVFDLYYDRALRAEGTLLVRDTSSVTNLFSSSRVYSKGAMVLHMLRKVTGDEVFRDILRAYTADASVRYGTASTADFQRVAEQVSGRDLDVFFRQWVTEGIGHPQYEVWWRGNGDSDGYTVELLVDQVQLPPASSVDAFEMPVHVRVETRAGFEEFVVLNTERNQVFELPVQGFPENLEFDPGKRILGTATVNILGASTEEQPEFLRSLDVYPNPVVDQLYVVGDMAEPLPVSLSLYDVLGRRVWHLRKEAAMRFSLRVSSSELVPGSYFLTVETPRGRVVRKVAMAY